MSYATNGLRRCTAYLAGQGYFSELSTATSGKTNMFSVGTSTQLFQTRFYSSRKEMHPQKNKFRFSQPSNGNGNKYFVGLALLLGSGLLFSQFRRPYTSSSSPKNCKFLERAFLGTFPSASLPEKLNGPISHAQKIFQKGKKRGLSSVESQNMYYYLRIGNGDLQDLDPKLSLEELKQIVKQAEQQYATHLAQRLYYEIYDENSTMSLDSIYDGLSITELLAKQGLDASAVDLSTNRSAEDMQVLIEKKEKAYYFRAAKYLHERVMQAVSLTVEELGPEEYFKCATAYKRAQKLLEKSGRAFGELANGKNVQLQFKRADLLLKARYCAYKVQVRPQDTLYARGYEGYLSLLGELNVSEKAAKSASGWKKSWVGEGPIGNKNLLEKEPLLFCSLDSFYSFQKKLDKGSIEESSAVGSRLIMSSPVEALP